MEQLDPPKRELIKKMSNIRLVAKLIESGEDEDKVQTMTRTDMMAAWAEIVAAEKDKSPVVSSHTGYDPELERKRLEFEMWKYERESAKEEREASERKIRVETEAAERKAREEREAAREERELELKETEIR